MQIIYVYASQRSGKKWTAEFKETGVKIHFGAKNYEDYTIHKNSERMKRYIARHAARENWNNMYSAGFWSRWLLWNKPSIISSARDIEGRYGVKVILRR